MPKGEGGQLDAGRGVNVAQAIPREGSDAARGHELERREVLKSIDISWDDQYVLDFAKQYPDVVRPFVDDLSKIAAMDRNSPDYVPAKAKFFEKMIPTLDENLKGLYGRIGELEHGLGTETDLDTRAKIKEVFLLNQKFLKDISDFKGNIILYQSAYERFSDNRAEIEKRLMVKIKAGKIMISDEFPYVTFVNKNPNEQYVLVYKYNKNKQTLSLKSCNLVSTGDQLRWKEDEPYDHTTPSKIYYVGSVIGLEHKSIKDEAEIYGSEAMRIEQKPYQVFRLYEFKGGKYVYTPYLVHPTEEEPLLGMTASHGCIRTSRLTNLQIQKVYEEYFRKQGVTDFSKFPPDKMRTPKAKMPVVIDDISQ